MDELYAMLRDPEGRIIISNVANEGRIGGFEMN